MRKVLSAIHLGVSLILLAAVIAEFLFAGMGVFHATTFQIHRVTGYSIVYGSMLLLLISLIGLLGRARVLLSALLVLLMMIQSLLVHVPQPFVEALHPLNGLVIMGVAATLVRLGFRARARSLRPAPTRA